MFLSGSSSRLTCVDEIFTVYEDIKNVADSVVRYSLFSSIKSTHDFHLSTSLSVVGNPIFIHQVPLARTTRRESESRRCNVGHFINPCLKGGNPMRSLTFRVPWELLRLNGEKNRRKYRHPPSCHPPTTHTSLGPATKHFLIAQS